MSEEQNNIAEKAVNSGLLGTEEAMTTFDDSQPLLDNATDTTLVPLNTDEEYFQMKAISNSALNTIDPQKDGSPRMFSGYIRNTLERKETSYMGLGTHVHRYFLEPDKFCVIDVPKPNPTTKIGVFTQAYYDYRYSTDLKFQLKRGAKHSSLVEEEALNYARRTAEYAERTTDATIRKDFNEAGRPYIDALVANQGKTFLTANEKSALTKIKESVKLKPVFFDWMDDSRVRELHGEVEIHNEIALTGSITIPAMITGTLITLPIKGKLDRIIIDHKNKCIYLLDLKTTGGGVYNFNKTVNIYRIDRQLALYQHLLSIKYPEYKVFCKIGIIQTTGLYEVAIADLDSTWLSYGWESAKQLLSRVAFHYEQHDFTSSIEEIENGGTLLLTKPTYL